MKVTKNVVVDASLAKAFRVFTQGIDRWWPREHHIGSTPMKKAVLEPKVGGRWYAVNEDGSEIETGKVLAWEPPPPSASPSSSARIAMTWQITAEWKYDPAFVTEVHVTFTQESARRTRVELEHRYLERYGAAAEEQAKTLEGWQGSLDAFGAQAKHKAVVLYELADGAMPKAMELFPAHNARNNEFAARGELLATGPFGDPRDGAMGVFDTREAAEEFIRGDPFVTGGVVGKWTIRDWREVLLP